MMQSARGQYQLINYVIIHTLMYATYRIVHVEMGAPLPPIRAVLWYAMNALTVTI